jgi:hypothetical protein
LKLRIGLIIGIVLCALIIASIGVFYFINDVLNLFQNTELPTTQLSATPVITATPLPTTPSQTVASNLPSPTKTMTPSTSPSLSPTAVNSTTPSPSSDISFNILSVEGSGFSRTVTGELTNTGSIDLHNSKLKIEMFSNGKLIKNDSKPYVEKNYDTLKAGAVITDVLAIKLSLVDGVTVQQNGVTFTLIFSSDEKTQTFKYDFQP